MVVCIYVEIEVVTMKICKEMFFYVFYFWCVLLITNNQSQEITDNEGFSNHLADTKPEIEKFRIKHGTSIKLKCTSQGKWEYKPCEFTYKGMFCNIENNNHRGDNRNNWKKIASKYRLKINSANRNHSGVYRCTEKDEIIKLVTIEVVSSDNYIAFPPLVVSLTTFNITNNLNMEFTIQCNVSSVIPPTIIWFKKCYGLKCDIKYDETCYCHLNINISVYHIGNSYIEKINIFNARELDSGIYACLAVTEYGKDYKNITIKVPVTSESYRSGISYSPLFIVPLNFIFIPIIIWLCYFKQKKKAASLSAEQRKKLLNPVVTVSTTEH